MPTLNGITASPTTIQPGQTSLITVDATPDPAAPDETYTILGQVVGTGQQASVDVTLDNPPQQPVRFVTSGGVPGDVLVTAPDGGTLVPVTGQAGKFNFTP